MKYFFIICFLITAPILGNSQSNAWITSPIKHPVRLAGTFGELRSNHFHTGIDIKSSNGKIGDPINSVADGFVSRIKISISGYGHALYIDHPNGMTSVYGHMEDFNEEIEKFIIKCQYANKSYEIDTTLSKSLFVVKKGQFIGRMGSTGRSYGPHLHFELRNTKSEVAINPLFYGFDIPDKLSPKIDYLMINSLDDKQVKRAEKKVALTKSGNNYVSNPPIIQIPAWRCGLVVAVQDLMTGVSNKNGIYKAAMKVDNELVFEFEMDSISFEHYRYLNGHVDYELYKDTKDHAHQMFRNKGNFIPIYKENGESVIKLFSEKTRKVEIEISDFHGNISTLKVEIQRDTNMLSFPEKSFQYFLEYNKPHIINKKDIKIFFPEGSFYHDIYLGIESARDKEKYYRSPVFLIGDIHDAVHGSFDTYIRHNIKDSTMIKKAAVVLCEENKYSTYGGSELDGMIGTKLYEFGAYVVMIDTIRPTIVELSAPLEVKNLSKISFKVDDNMVAKGLAKDLQCNAYLDGRWILMKYDLKNKTLTHTVSSRWESGDHKFKLIVKDDRGNESIWERNFMKK